jgi:hypothetical protein
MRYVKKPVEIDAWLYDGNPASMAEAILMGLTFVDTGGELKIPTLEGEMTASTGDYVIRGIKGEFYPCKPDIFHATYRPVNW